MAMCDGQVVPRRIYQAVPAGWAAHQIVDAHARLGGNFALGVPAPRCIHSRHALPEQDGWLHYHRTVHRLADGVRADDPGCTELAVRYIELRHIGSCSGYLRARLARALKHATLDERQRRRLHEHFAALCLEGRQLHEFGEYVRLWRRIIRPHERDALLAALRALPDGERRAARLAATLAQGAGPPRHARAAAPAAPATQAGT